MTSNRTLPALLLTSLLSLSPVACGDGGGDGDGDGGSLADGGGGEGGGENGGGVLPAEACRRLDIVFSIDPSGSMREELESMSTTVFPAFADALRKVGGGVDDYRVGVIDACPTPADFHTRGETSGECQFSSGEAWMTSKSETLDAEFACVGDIYKASECSGANDDEQPTSAALAALSGENPGFLRDDGLLVVVALTDEDECANPPDCDDISDARAEALYTDLVALKGDVRKTVFLGIGGGPGGCKSGEGVYGGADESVLLRKITDRFSAADRGVWWDLCDGQLEDGLTEAIAVIDQACRELPQVD